MTRTVGYIIKGAPCCGARYKTPRYASMNWMSAAFWSDGYREQSLMPNDHGLRRCQCGRFILQRDLVEMAEVDQSDLPRPPYVSPVDLPLVIAQADRPVLELAARRDYWQHLNHAYRDAYKAHREAEDAATQAAWEAAHPDQRTAWQKLRKFERNPKYQAAPDRPITFPVFEPSPVQRENMLVLLQLTQALGDVRGLELVELYRELGQFDDAARTLQAADKEDSPSLYQISAELIEGRHTAPVRYRP
jgi:hypothetical protein